MKAKGWGRIVNMASINDAMFATVNRVDYIATRTALSGLTRAVALEVARIGVIRNAICPRTVLIPAIEGRLRQEMQRNGTMSNKRKRVSPTIHRPSRRSAKDGNVAGLIAFCADHTGRTSTGRAAD
jgi:3-hydroxybutyrate dehydrogenase